MPNEETIKLLKESRDNMAKAFQKEASDDILDNGNLEHIYKAIINVETAIKEIEARG